ncbi:MAG: MmcB family DNA repair protein [Azospirillaceae bacterium]
MTPDTPFDPSAAGSPAFDPVSGPGGDPRTDPTGAPGAGAEKASIDGAAGITRGVRRAFSAAGMVSVTEFSLKTGRRADILAIDPKGLVTIVEVKSGPADFRADRKWPDYEAFCDRFYFAVGPDFPIELLPEDRGLIVADAWDAMVLREGPVAALPAPRRKAVLLRFAHAAAGRLHRIEDPRL